MVKDKNKSTVESPCVRRCTLNEKDVCLGCGRTLAEILNWHNLTYEQKLKIIKTFETQEQTRKNENENESEGKE